MFVLCLTLFCRDDNVEERRQGTVLCLRKPETQNRPLSPPVSYWKWASRVRRTSLRLAWKWSYGESYQKGGKAEEVLWRVGLP